MKAFIGFTILFIVAIVMCSLCMAEEAVDPIGIDLSIKQGFLMNWNDPDHKFNNLSTFEIAKTRKVESWGMWNALWTGWSLDAGFAYDANEISTVALLVGREFGTLGDYLPIDFPLNDLITITIYPIGVYAEDVFNSPEFGVCSGGSYIKFSLKS